MFPGNLANLFIVSEVVLEEGDGAARVDTTRMQLVDGSGLARQNLITSTMTANLLSYMYHHPDEAVRTSFMDSLPIGGVDGTLSSRMRGTPAGCSAGASSASAW